MRLDAKDELDTFGGSAEGEENRRQSLAIFTTLAEANPTNLEVRQALA
jgi:hypothetical protein